MTWDWQEKKPTMRCPKCRKKVTGQAGAVWHQDPVTKKYGWWHHKCAGFVSTLLRGTAYVRALRWRDAGKRAMKKSDFHNTIKKLGRG